MRWLCSGLFWLIMQMTHNIPIDHVNVMETSLQSIGRLTQNLLPDEAGHLFIAGKRSGFVFATFVLFFKHCDTRIAKHNISFSDNKSKFGWDSFKSYTLWCSH